MNFVYYMFMIFQHEYMYIPTYVSEDNIPVLC
jgi:hypothetical protein